MLLTVKLLLGRRCRLKVSGKESVAKLKKLVSEQLQVPEERQHLLFRGRRLADDKHLSDYSIGPNASINVIVRPLEKTAPGEAHPAPRPPQSQPRTLWHQLGQVLGRHFGPQDAQAVLQMLRQEHEARLRRWSLEDLERLARKHLPEEKRGKPGEREPVALGSEATGHEGGERG